jgi:hypothetical protein
MTVRARTIRKITALYKGGEKANAIDLMRKAKIKEKDLPECHGIEAYARLLNK